MSDQFRIDPEGVSNATGKLHSAGDALSSAFDTLKGVLDAHDGCWGDDDTGKAFGEKFQPAEDEARGGASDVAKGVNSIADNVTQSADQFESTDEASAAQMDQQYVPQQ